MHQINPGKFVGVPNRRNESSAVLDAYRRAVIEYRATLARLPVLSNDELAVFMSWFQAEYGEGGSNTLIY